ncbi:MAG: AtpZ/AtpI family protein [Patescibacteria group bacterium]|jgi:F0F1-type ATP synthase assembly protein I
MPSVEKDNKNKDKNDLMRLAMTMFVEASGWIAFPVIGALFLGRWLDDKQGTEPLYFISITALAFIVSSVGIGKTGVKYMKKIEQEDALKKQDKNESRDK